MHRVCDWGGEGRGHLSLFHFAALIMHPRATAVLHDIFIDCLECLGRNNVSLVVWEMKKQLDGWNVRAFAPEGASAGAVHTHTCARMRRVS